MQQKRKKQSRAMPFKREFTALVVFLCILAVLFGVVHAVRPQRSRPVGGKADRETESLTALAEDYAMPDTVPGAAPADGDKVIYLTFDDGPTKNTTRILDALDSSGVKATFFVIHTYDGCERQIKEIYDRGHQVALHSYSHAYNIYASQEAFFADLQKISDLVYNATGFRSMLLRFPGGSSNTISRKYAQGIMTTLTKAVEEKGYVYFDWNWDSMDASNRGKDAASIIDYSTRPIGKDDQVILLMHDSATKKATVEALPEVIRTYKQAGYRFDVLSTKSFVHHHTVNN